MTVLKNILFQIATIDSKRVRVSRHYSLWGRQGGLLFLFRPSGPVIPNSLDSFDRNKRLGNWDTAHCKCTVYLSLCIYLFITKLVDVATLSGYLSYEAVAAVLFWLYYFCVLPPFLFYKRLSFFVNGNEIDVIFVVGFDEIAPQRILEKYISFQIKERAHYLQLKKISS